MNSLKEKVEYCLERDKSVRDCDKKLTIAVWIAFYSSQISLIKGSPCVSLENIIHLPSEDKISRIRRLFQEKKQYIGSLEVMKKRGWAEDKWRRFLGYNNK